jgi:hypothetical protein
MDVIVNKIKYGCGVVGIKDRSAGLNRQGAFKLIGRYLLGDIEHHVAFNALLRRINMVGPYPVVHELINGILQCLKYLFIGSLDLLTHHLNITSQFLSKCGD